MAWGASSRLKFVEIGVTRNCFKYVIYLSVPSSLYKYGEGDDRELFFPVQKQKNTNLFEKVFYYVHIDYQIINIHVCTEVRDISCFNELCFCSPECC